MAGIEGSTPTPGKPILIIDEEGNQLGIFDPTAARTASAALVPADTETELEGNQPSTDVSCRTPERTIHTTTVPRRVYDAFIEGPGFIYTGACVTVLIATMLGLQIVPLILSLTHVISAAIAALGSILMVAVMVAGIAILGIGRGAKTRVLVVKGCAKGPTPGSHKIRV